MENERRLIDATLLSEKWKAVLDAKKNEKDTVAYRTFELFIARLEKEPTVDAVEVVRCLDCVYWGDEDGLLTCSDGLKVGRCTVHNYLINGRHTGWCPAENDFCSYGERKEGDDNG